MKFLQQQDMIGRQGFPDALRVRKIDFRHKRGAEHEPSRMTPGQLEDASHGLGGLGGRRRPAHSQGVFFKRGLHVNGKMRSRRKGQDVFDNVRAHAVGVDLDRRAEGGKLGHEPGQARGQGGFAAADDHAIQPGAAGLEEGAHVLFPYGGEAFGRKGQPGVVAVRASEVAAAEKDHGADPSRPIAQRKGFKPPNDVPC